MWCGIITLFPEMFSALNSGISGRAIEKGLIDLSYYNPRDFADNRHKTVDDRPYGGGPGMLMMVPPLRKAIQAARKAAGRTAEGEVRTTEEVARTAEKSKPTKTIYVSPQGKPFTQAAAEEFAKAASNLIFIAGRYEGVDERLIELEIDEEWSLGDYVLSGGELAIMVMLDAIIRLLPGALGHEDSAGEDSFAQNGLLDCPHYTRPEAYEGLQVPEVLLSGDHATIAQWRLKQSLGRTFLRRPDLLTRHSLDKKQEKLLQEFLENHKMLEDL